MAIRRPRRSLVVLAACAQTSDVSARALAASLAEMGIEAVYLGREQSARCIAVAAAEARADSVELCLPGGRGVLLIRELLRELIRVGRRDVSIVAHRAETATAGRRSWR
jgi:methylmalonyl-CoA mutase cobalamin-binding subunit